MPRRDRRQGFDLEAALGLLPDESAFDLEAALGIETDEPTFDLGAELDRLESVDRSGAKPSLDLIRAATRMHLTQKSGFLFANHAKPWLWGWREDDPRWSEAEIAAVAHPEPARLYALLDEDPYEGGEDTTPEEEYLAFQRAFSEAWLKEIAVRMDEGDRVRLKELLADHSRSSPGDHLDRGGISIVVGPFKFFGEE